MTNSINRRHFLATAAVTAATSGFSASRAAAVAPRVKLQKAVKFSMVAGKGSVQEKFQLLVDAGFTGVDINVRLDHAEVSRARGKTGRLVHGVEG